MTERYGWMETGTASGQVTVAKAAEAGSQHIIYGVYAAFDSTAEAGLTISDGTTLFQTNVYDAGSFTFPAGFVGAVGAAVTAVLSSGGVVGRLNMHGTTRKSTF